ncbi:hypothetical protein EBR21_13660 [bacterium]|nr:hypothetical protein [bacterium]
MKASPAFEESRNSFVVRSVRSLQIGLGDPGIRYCEGCGVTYSKVRDNGLELISPDSMTLADVADFDNAMRGAAPPAQTGWWIGETPEGISVRGVSLVTGRIVFAQNIGPALSSQARTQKNYTAARDLLRRQRGESLTHTVFDLGVYPSQHFSVDWLEQWGQFNHRFFGVSLSIFDPVLGLGASYAEAFPGLMNSLLGGKLMMSVPTALIKSLTRNLGGTSPNGIDPLLTLVGIARVPFPFFNGDYALNIFFSTNGRVGLGVSTLNTSLLPVVP